MVLVTTLLYISIGLTATSLLIKFVECLHAMYVMRPNDAVKVINTV